jgi:hypothetical protein
VSSATCIRMQRTGSSPDTVITQVLAQSERRQYRLARLPPKSKGSDKPVESGLEEMEWELCLRTYFEYVESWLPGSSVYASSAGRRSPYPQPMVSGSVKRTPSNGSNFSDFKVEEDMDTSIFYRKPRRRGSISSRASSDDDNDKRTMSLRSNPTNALVPYSPVSSNITTVSRPRIIRRTSITSDFHWEYVGKSSTFSTLAPLTARWPELKDAQVDIYTQTQAMPASEARAYAQGRLACLSPEIISEVRQTLSLQDRPQSTKLIQDKQYDSSARTRHSQSPQSLPSSPTVTSSPSLSRGVPPRRPVGSPHLSKPESAIAPLSKQHPVLNLSPPPIPKSKTRSKHKEPRTFEQTPRLIPRPKSRGSWKNTISSLAELRPLTAISERPSTSRTTRSKASSFDRPPSLASLVPSFRRKSTLSQQVLPALPDGEVPGRSSRGSDETVVEKALPLIPKSRKQRLLAVFRRDEDEAEREDYLTDLPLAMPPSMLSLTRDRKASSESLRRVSMELLKRKDSKVALLAVTEGLDLPFDLWVKALPYIEGVRNVLD